MAIQKTPVQHMCYFMQDVSSVNLDAKQVA